MIEVGDSRERWAVLGVDIGGTFTDVVVVSADGQMSGAKVPTTRGRLSDAVLEGTTAVLREAQIDPGDVVRFVHGTTVATNAILERRGARTGVLMTAGFRDVLDIGRYKRRSMYDLNHGPQTPGFLSPRRLRREVSERLDERGEVVVPLDLEAGRSAVAELVADGIESLAVCFLFAHRNPVHEQELLKAIASDHPELHVAISSDISPVSREYERLCVTGFDAYIRPLVNRYLAVLVRELKSIGVDCPVQIVLSSGVASSLEAVARRPVETLLSGLAGGVQGARVAGAAAGEADLISFDMGGTSCDVALVLDGALRLTSEGQIDGHPLQLPMVDVRTIGAGGGSLAWLASDGSLRVGPQSAGSEPGPAAYGRGGADPTVTDASLVLGYLNPARFGGGRTPLRSDLAERAVARVAASMGATPNQAALAIHRIVNERMADLVRLVTVSAGHDPRRYALVAFGGAGPIHATRVARILGVSRVIVPSMPGLLCAVGHVLAPFATQLYVSSLIEIDAEAAFDSLEEAVTANERILRGRLATSGDDRDGSRLACFLGMRYARQSHELEVAIDIAAGPPALAEAVEGFLWQYRAIYGHDRGRSGIQIATIRVVLEVPVECPVGAAVVQGTERAGTTRQIQFGGQEPMAVPILDRSALPAGERIDGPAIIEQDDTTTVIYPGDSLLVAPDGTLIVTVGR